MPPENTQTILVVDDDEVSLAVICMMLEAEGFRVLRASDGKEAVREAAEVPDEVTLTAVLADLQMPGLCGRELALALRTLVPEARLLAMSATPGPAESYDGFVRKPFDLAAFRALLSLEPVEAAAPGTDGGDSAALDEEIYLKLQRMMPPEALAEVYEACLHDAREKAAQMSRLLEQGSRGLVEIRRAAHAIKGGAGMVGATQLARSASELELGVYEKGDVPHLVNKLLDSCEELQRILMTKVNPC